MKKISIFVVAIVLLSLPILSFAAPYRNGTYIFPVDGTFVDVMFWMMDWVNLLIQGIIALAVIAFLWGVVKSIYHADETDARTDGRNFMIYGIIALAVMLSFWGLVAFVQRSIGVESAVPQFKGQAIPTTGGATNPF